MDSSKEAPQQPIQPTQAPQYQPEVPQEVKKWNWGAFSFNIFWGIGNKTYLPLLCLVPLLNVVWIFICGAKGNEWAWKDGNYRDVELFKKVQASWNRAGFVQFIIALVVIAFYILIAIFALFAASSVVDY